MGLVTVSIEELSTFSWSEINTITDCLNIVNEKNHANVADDSVEMACFFDESSMYGGLPDYLVERLAPEDIQNLNGLLELDGPPISVRDVARTLIAHRA